MRSKHYVTDEGLKDIKSKTLRCINSFEDTFKDPSRYIRAIRFCVSKGFKMDSDLKKYFEENAAKQISQLGLKDLWSITKEIDKMFNNDTYFVDSMISLMENNLFIGMEKLTTEDLLRSKFRT